MLCPSSLSSTVVSIFAARSGGARREQSAGIDLTGEESHVKKSMICLSAAAILAFGMTGAVAYADQPATQHITPTAGPNADELRAAVDSCDKQLSDGEYAKDEEGSAEIPVCQSGDSVHWKADFDVDCDGQPTDVCNEDTDPAFQPETAFPQSDGDPLIAAKLPYIVVPSSSDIWDYTSADIDGGTVAAVTYEDKVVYAVVGDTGPDSIIGEGSYALADELGIDPDPSTGGVDGAVVDFILFPGTVSDPIEDHAKATAAGEAAASKLVGA